MANGPLGIDQNKETPKRYNYHAGIVGLRVLIEPYCPFTSAQKSSFTLIFNGVTFQKFLEDEQRKLSFVPNDIGVYLKEIYNYRNNYLIFKTKEKDTYENLDLPIEQIVSPLYKEDQSWVAVPHPMVEKEILLPSQYQENANDCCSSKARWKYNTLNVPTEFDERILQDISFDTPGLERLDGNIIYPTLGSAYPNQQQVKTNSSGFNSNTTAKLDENPGIHWRVIKKTNLYQGEDFFIDFRKVAISADITKKKPITKWKDNNYYYLNVYEDLGGERFANQPPPENQALVGYKYEVEESEEESESNENVTSITRSIVYTQDEGSRKYFDLNNQAYYIVEMGVNGTGITEGGTTNKKEDKDKKKETDCTTPILNNQKYFIFITQNSNPTFIRVKNDTTYHLSTYKGVSGAELIEKKDSFRMTVRNHLGRIIITFSGYENNPWIIENIRLSDDDYSALVVPKDQISIWGGNIQSGFIFSPLQYEESQKIVLPPGYKVHGQDFELPKNTTNRYIVTMASGQVGEGGLNSPVRQGTVQGPPMDNGNYIYTCDAQCIRESRSVFSGDNEYEERAEEGIFQDVYYLGVNNLFIKECQGNCPVLKDGKISIEKNKNRKSAISLVYHPTKTFSTSKDGSDAKKFDIQRFWLSAELVSGCHTFESGWFLKNCKTPVISQITCYNTPEEEDLWTPLLSNGLDISHRVTNFSDSWSTSDYTKVEHTGSMQVLLNDSPRLTEEDRRANGFSVNTLTLLKKMLKRAFYFTIDVAYDKCYNSNSQSNNQYTKLAPNYIRMFTGICMNSSLEQKSGENYMTCQLKDYSIILENSFFFNSPFFDGMRDINAVHEIIKIGSFKTYNGTNNFPAPGGLIAQAAASSATTVRLFGRDGRQAIMDSYALPQSYDRLTNAYFRFKDGDPLWSAIGQFSQRSGKALFFDTYGQLRYENRKFDSYLFSDAGQEPEPDWYFTTIPTNGGIDGQLIFNVVNREWDINSVYNDIHVLTSTPNGELLIGHDTDYYGIIAAGKADKPEGWLGFKRTLFQQESIFGSTEALKKQITNLTRAYSPPRVVKFETFGQPIRALDVALIRFPDQLNGQKIIVTSVNNTINAQENKWWQNIEGDWIGPTKKVQFDGDSQNPSPQNDAGGEATDGSENAADAADPNLSEPAIA